MHRVGARELRAEEEDLRRVVDPHDDDHQRPRRAERGRDGAPADVDADQVLADPEEERGEGGADPDVAPRDSNYFVPPNYDSMIGKIIVHGDTREQALARMRIALSETVVEGIQTNIPLHRELMVDAKFIEGGTSIHYLEGWMASAHGDA